jgi:Protein of unknown function (DUF2490)
VKVENSRWRHRLPVEALLALAVAIIPCALLGQATGPYPRQDFQGWVSIEGTHPLSEKTDFRMGADFRYSNNQGHLTYRRITAGFAYHWNRLVTVEPYYQYLTSDSFSGPAKPENRLALATTIGAPWKHWHVSDRNLGERRFLINGQEWRYRNRLEFRRPVVWARKQLSVFAWDEVFYSSTIHRWYRNRLALGAGRKLSKRISVDVYYLRQNDGYSHPGDLNALGLTLKTLF